MLYCRHELKRLRITKYVDQEIRHTSMHLVSYEYLFMKLAF